MEKDNEKIEYITKAYLEEQMGEQAKIIISAVDGVLVKRLGDMENRLKIDIKNVRDELYIVRDELKADINSNQALIDGYVKAQEDFKQEFVIMKEEIRKMKMILKEKLGVEISAI
jgi:hypothetical protein